MGEVHFIGGMNVPWTSRLRMVRRFNTFWPFASFTINDSHVILQPRLLREMVHADFVAVLSDISFAFPLSGHPFTSGIGLDLFDGRIAYFWTRRHRQAALDSLGQRGVILDSTPRDASAAWPFGLRR